MRNAVMRHALAPLVLLLAVACSDPGGRVAPSLTSSAPVGAAGAPPVDEPTEPAEPEPLWSQTFAGSAPLDPHTNEAENRLGWISGRLLCPSVSAGVLPNGFTGVVTVGVSLECQAAGIQSFYAGDSGGGPMRFDDPQGSELGARAVLTVRRLECDAAECRWDYSWAFWTE